jgi:PAS domain S-box-containing protein
VAILVAATGLFVVFLYAFFVFIPALNPGAGPISLAHLRLLNAAALAVVAAALIVTAGPSPWRRVYAVLAVAGAASLLLQLADGSVKAADALPTGSLLQLSWLVPFLLGFVAVGVSPPSGPRVEAVENPGPPPIAIAVPALAVPLIGYSSLVLLPHGTPDSAVRELVAALMTIGGLGLLTLRLYAQGGELQRADARARLLGTAVEQTGDAVLVTRADGRYEHANDAFLRASGYTRDELVAMAPAEPAARGLTSATGPVLDEIRDRGVWRGTTTRRRRDGSTFHAACTIVGLRDAGGRLSHFVAVEHDLSDELRLREQLVHAERLSAMGALIAGIAHEINNPLQTILGSAELLMDEQPQSHRELDLVRREAARAAQIVRNLLSFVRRTTPDRASMDLNVLVRSTVDLREYHLTRSNISLDVSLHPEPLPVMVNREEIQQVVLNLVLNAEQVLEAQRGGTIAIRTFPRGGAVVVEVADSGPGIGPELRGRIFEPFFTTKEVGEGTGLGLSISHGIAQSHGGALELCEGRLSGACFELSLPAQFERPVGDGAPGVEPTRR